MAYVLSTLAYIDISTLTSCLLRNICLKSCSCLQVEIAARYGALGVIIYSDPADYTWSGDPRYFPETWFLPSSGAQRGSLYTGVGDPLTPGYPSIGLYHCEKQHYALVVWLLAKIFNS